MPNLAPKLMQDVQPIPAQIVGGNHFGYYPKISREETFNFIISDGALVPYAGYKNVLTKESSQKGRGIYSSSRGNVMVVVWGSSVYSITKVGTTLAATFRGAIASSTGAVFMSENNNAEIAISDGTPFTLYYYNWLTNVFAATSLPGGASGISSPGYISFQNGRFILANTDSNSWYLSGFNDVTSWSVNANSVGSLQSKPDTVQAVVPVPGGGNNILVFGHTVAEPWQDINTVLFPYQRNSTNTVDYGCINASTIATLETFIVWLSTNEQSGVVLMVYSGGDIRRISTDGIDFKMASLTHPEDCIGFLYRQDGHLIYQFTFFKDNLSYIYDFNSQQFCTVTDEHLNYHIAQNVVYFNNAYYFVSMNGGNLYQFGSQFTDADYGGDDVQVLPRIRVLPPFRMPSQRMFICKSLGFTIENGQPNAITTQQHSQEEGDIISTESLVMIATEGGTLIADEAGVTTVVNTYTNASEVVDLSLSRDGGESFGASVRLAMNPVGKRKSRFIFQRLGQANDVTAQLRFTGFGRFVVFDGELEVYS